MSFEESMEIMQRAVKLWQQVDQEPSEQQYHDFVSLVSLAINKAGEPVAIYHSILSQVHFDVGNYPDAWQEAEKTLAIADDDFKAQCIKSIIAYAFYSDAMEESQNKKLGLMDTLGVLSNMTQGYRKGEEAGRKIGEAIGSKKNAAQAKTLFAQEMKNLVTVYKKVCANGIDAEDFLDYSQRLIKMADGLGKSGISLEGEMNLYALVANTPTDQIVCETDEEKENIKTAQLIAQGRMAA